MESSSIAQHEHAIKNTAKWAIYLIITVFFVKASKTLSPFDLGAKTVGSLGSSHFFEAGLGKRINMIMQTVFFKLSGDPR